MQVAFLVDGSFLIKKYQSALKTRALPAPQAVIDLCKRVLEDAEFDNDHLFRIYFYDCYPFSGSSRHPLTGKEENFGKSKIFKERSEFLNTLKLLPRVALRAGKLLQSGWKMPAQRISQIVRKVKAGKPLEEGDLVPNFSQKEVDIKIGLDIAWLASKRIVEKIVLVTGDMDFVPAMKFARREGVMVYLAHLDHQVREDLKEHCDGIIEIKY